MPLLKALQKKVIVSLLFIGLFLISSNNVSAAENSLGQWNLTSSFNNDRYAPATTSTENFVYILNGFIQENGNNYDLASVEFAPVNSDGTLGSWQSTSSTNIPRYNASAVISGNHIYIIGGQNSSGITTTVEMATINSDGTLSSWEFVNNLTTHRVAQSSVSVNGYIYAIGGITNNNLGANGSIISSVEKAQVNSDGTLGSWELTSSMNVGRGIFGAAATNDTIYAIGGEQNIYDNPAPDYPLGKSVEAASINSDGTLGPWSYVSFLNSNRQALGAAIIGDSLYAVGGTYTPSEAYLVEVVTINSDGSLGSWAYTTSMNSPRSYLGVVTAQNKIYAIGGTTNANLNGLLKTVEWTTINQPPVINGLSGASIEPNENYEEAGAFLDGDSTSWTGSVDYGDGSGTQALNLTGTDFFLSHTYSSPGSFTVTVSITDNQGAIGTQTATVEVANLAPVYLNPSADSYLKQGSSNENEGASTILRLQSSGKNRALIVFNETEIENAIGNSQDYTAILRFTISDNGNNWGTIGRTISLHRLTSSWSEGNGFIFGNNPTFRGTGLGATWKCASDSNISNQNDDCSGGTAWEMTNSGSWPFITTPTATSNITNNQNGVIEMDVTSDVANFISQTNQNYGWVLKKTDEGANGRIEFGSKESASSPQLVITFN